MTQLSAIDNFEQIAELLEFRTDDDYYHLQILKRKKENPEMSSNNIVITTHVIKSKKQLLGMKDDLVAICEGTRARAYINLNTKSFKRSTLEMLKEIATNVACEQYQSHRLFNRVSGKTNSPTNDKKWILDIDDHEWLDRNMDDLETIVDNLQPLGKKVIDVINTKNGKHVICKPFNLCAWEKEIESKDADWHFDIQKNNPTILYVPSL